ncbi:MAG TPA: hypothetical protein VD788_13520, partial [Candidatus Polarisedimenticolaceae bacterium]|nr:hypothetical protein [Candidatus Polarisedimenticolaceae bacterium]
MTLVTAGQLEEGAARLEQASEDLSDPIVWCYSRMYLADAHFQLGRAAADSTARERHYESARAWFRQASYCAGAELPADGESARPTPEQVEVIANFQTFGTEDLASQLERVSSAQSELLSSTQDHQAVADHWRLVTQMSGATREAEYRIALACFEDGDFDCAATEAVAGSLLTDSTEPAEPARAIAERAIERAAEVGPPEADTYWRFVFRLVADWHRQEPLDDGPDTVLENALGALDPAERLRLLELSEDCWVPLRVAEGLRDRQAEFVDEAKVAYACDPAGPAKNLLVDH